MGVISVGSAADLPHIQAHAAPAPHVRTAEPALGEAVGRPQPVPAPNEEQVQRAKAASRSSNVLATPARLRVDGGTGRIVVQILDDNEQVVRQIPPEELLRIASKFKDLQGLLFDEST